MVTPEEIRTKAGRAYPKVLAAWAQGDVRQLFPLPLRANLSLIGNDLPAARAAVEKLRAKSKEEIGWGYTVHCEERRSRDFGKNPFPLRITVDTLDDFLRLTRKRPEVDRIVKVAKRLRQDLPGLNDWLVKNTRRLATLVEPLEGLIAVTQFFLDHPWPDCYARQIAVSPHTKFIEAHETVLGEWLNELLPASAIKVDESKFPRRFGLRDKEPNITIRVLDSGLQSEIGLPFDELSLPLRHLAALPVRGATVFIVENRLNLLTLPPVRRGMAIRGEGDAVTQLITIQWLADNRVIYWGDIDLEGFEILSRLRRYFPDVRSFLMDHDTLRQFGKPVGKVKSCRETVQLTEKELAAYHDCLQNHRWVEQEHIPQTYVDAAIRDLRLDVAAASSRRTDGASSGCF